MDGIRNVGHETRNVNVNPRVRSVCVKTFCDRLVSLAREAPTGDAPTGEAPTGEAPTGDAPTGGVVMTVRLRFGFQPF